MTPHRDAAKTGNEGASVNRGELTDSISQPSGAVLVGGTDAVAGRADGGCVRGP